MWACEADNSALIVRRARNALSPQAMQDCVSTPDSQTAASCIGQSVNNAEMADTLFGAPLMWRGARTFDAENNAGYR